MYNELFPQLGIAISQERLEPYRQAGDRDELCPFARYIWNMTLSEALYPALQGIEIALRNSIHRAATDTFGGNDLWFSAKMKLLDYREQEKVQVAKKKLERENKKITAGRIVAELNFGFWTSLLNRRYEQVLWPKMLKSVFPSVPRRPRNRQDLFKRLNSVRHLRNRVFHYEPIWYRKDLQEQHTRLLEAISWINPAMYHAVTTIDRFPEVHKQGYEPYRKRLLKLTDR